jgi:predicted secreted protein
VTFAVYPEGDSSTDTYYTGTAIVTEVSRTASFDGLVEASVSLQGTGALSESTVA